ncbi:MAG: tyrosine-type recombinase/integrase, partial [Bacteroidales bacterium]|nr:tyrosine-type recombinase/integrase [Bacteroidales bacterium]
MSNPELFIRYLREQKRYSERTCAVYGEVLSSFFRFAELSKEETELEEVTPYLLRGYVAWMMEEGRTPRTVQLHLSALSSYYRFMMKQGLCSSNPASLLVRPKAGRSIPDFYAREAINHLLDAPVDEDDFWQIQAHAVLHTLYSTGIRRAELAGLCIGDVDFRRGLIRVYGKGNKTREVPMTAALVDELHRFYAIRKGQLSLETEVRSVPLFVTQKGSKLPLSYVNKVVQAVLNGEQGIQGKKTPHR